MKTELLPLFRSFTSLGAKIVVARKILSSFNTPIDVREKFLRAIRLRFIDLQYRRGSFSCYRFFLTDDTRLKEDCLLNPDELNFLVCCFTNYNKKK